MTTKYYSKRKIYFKILMIIFFLVLGIYSFLEGNIYFTNQKIDEKKLILDQQNKELSLYQQETGYIKLDAIKELEAETDTMPWGDRINKIIEMLNELQKINPNQSGSILLSDFKVNLDSISLRGKVSSLLFLYYSDSSKNIISLFDRFENLDFIGDISIQTYTKTDDSFDFVLEAKVINDGK